ncbi:hypothetical protein D3C71_982350 [compost metagenome]
MGRFHTVALSGVAPLSGPGNHSDDKVLAPRVVRQTLCCHGQQAFLNTHLDEYRATQTTPPYSMEFRIWRTLEQPASLVAYSFGLLPSSRSCGFAIHVGPSLPKTSAARKNKSRWSSVLSVTAGSGFVSELACEGAGAFPGVSEWRFIMCALRWNKQVTTPTMTPTHVVLNTKSLASDVRRTEAIGTVEHRSVAFDLHFDITTN